MNIYHSESDLNQYYQSQANSSNSTETDAKSGWISGLVGHFGAGCLSALCLVVGVVFYRSLYR